jgi:hypothetical protein
MPLRPIGALVEGIVYWLNSDPLGRRLRSLDEIGLSTSFPEPLQSGLRCGSLFLPLPADITLVRLLQSCWSTGGREAGR